MLPLMVPIIIVAVGVFFVYSQAGLMRHARPGCARQCHAWPALRDHFGWRRTCARFDIHRKWSRAVSA